MQKKWQVKTKIDPKVKNRKKAIIDILLENRGIKREKDKEAFFNPKNPFNLSLKDIGVKKSEFNKVIKRLEQALEKKENIVIYGDYDADGITATAIMWETLHSFSLKVMPFLPHREEQGYGLKPKGIDDLVKELGKPDLIITVDNGIVAFEGAGHCRKLGIDLIICDHHEAIEKSNKYPENRRDAINRVSTASHIPECTACIHSTQTSGAGVAFLLAKEIMEEFKVETHCNASLQIENLIELATIGIIADVVPILGVSRSIAREGLKLLPKSQRPGLKALFTEAKLDTEKIFNTYQIGFVIAPRLNATGRLHHSIDSLRLLCTKKNDRAIKLALNLSSTNEKRQDMTNGSLEKVLKEFEGKKLEDKIIIKSSKDFNPGVIGLIAGKLTENFYRPSIVIAIIDGYAKGSVRSISGVDIISILRKFESDFVDLGGHKMAAGFTVETEKIEELSGKLKSFCNKNIGEKLLVPSVEMETEIEGRDLNLDIYEEIEKMAPFGMGNPHPLFMMNNLRVVSAQAVGKEKKHLKLYLEHESADTKIQRFGGIYFNAGEWIGKIKQEDQVDLAFQMSLNEWNGERKVEVMVREVKIN